ASQTVDRPATSGDAAVVTAATEDALHPVDQAVDDLRPQPDQHLRWPAVPDPLEQPLHGPLDRADRVGDETTDPLRAGLDRREHVAQAALVRLAVATDLAATGEPGQAAAQHLQEAVAEPVTQGTHRVHRQHVLTGRQHR